MTTKQHTADADADSDEPVDYRKVHIPHAMNPEDMTWRERRATILGWMENRHQPTPEQSQTTLADRFDVNQSTISRDLDRIRESIRYYVGDDIVVRAELVFMKAVDELMDAGEYRKATQVMSDWLEWLGDLGHIEREPDKAEITHDGTVGHAHAHEHRIDPNLREQLDAAKTHAEADAAPLSHATHNDTPTDTDPDEDTGAEIHIEDD